MNITTNIVAGAVLIGLSYALPPAANATAEPSRTEIKAETRDAEKAGKLVPAGQGPVETVPLTSQKTRGERKAETLAAHKDGTLEGPGPKPGYLADQRLRAQKTTVNRAARKAETRAEELEGKLVPAGEGPGAPRK